MFSFILSVFAIFFAILSWGKVKELEKKLEERPAVIMYEPKEKNPIGFNRTVGK